MLEILDEIIKFLGSLYPAAARISGTLGKVMEICGGYLIIY